MSHSSDTLKERFFGTLNVKARLGFGSSCAMHAAVVHLTPHPPSWWSTLPPSALAASTAPASCPPSVFPPAAASSALFPVQPHGDNFGQFHIVLLPVLPQVIIDGSLSGQTKCW